MARIFIDSSVLIRYLVEDDVPRALAAADLIDGDDGVVISTSVLLEVVHVLRRDRNLGNPEIGQGLIAFLSKENVELIDADRAGTVAALQWSLRVSARRIPDATSRPPRSWPGAIGSPRSTKPSSRRRCRSG